MGSKQLVRAGQISTLVLVVLACLWAPQIEKASSLWEYLQVVLSFIAPPVAATFIVGLFWKRANGTGSIVSLLFGFTYAIVWLISAEGFGVDNLFTNMHFLHRTALLFVLCAVLHIGVSLATEPPPEEKTGAYTWSRKLLEEETQELADLPWYKNYRYQSVILLIITFILVGYFW